MFPYPSSKYEGDSWNLNRFHQFLPGMDQLKQIISLGQLIYNQCEVRAVTGDPDKGKPEERAKG